MTFQPALLHESPEEALRDAVRAAGGSKVVGPKLWPSLSQDPNVAARKLDDHLNPARREALDIGEVLMILRLAREAGYHGAMEYLASDAGYSKPTPIDPLDERAQLQRDYIAATKTLQQIAARIERCAEPVGPRKVA